MIEYYLLIAFVIIVISFVFSLIIKRKIKKRKDKKLVLISIDNLIGYETRCAPDDSFADFLIKQVRYTIEDLENIIPQKTYHNFMEQLNNIENSNMSAVCKTTSIMNLMYGFRSILVNIKKWR